MLDTRYWMLDARFWILDARCVFLEEDCLILDNRRYKQEFIRFLTYALGSNDETIDHLETLFETGSLTDRPLYDKLHERTDMLGKKLNLFVQSVLKNHISEK